MAQRYKCCWLVNMIVDALPKLLSRQPVQNLVVTTYITVLYLMPCKFTVIGVEHIPLSLECMVYGGDKSFSTGFFPHVL